ncbi:phage tail protein [Photobacterium alginatilyticum]|uniref:phage tail protein n=1 Tax=Photobacterium alginatilyticum TaxID=1775171 RepID=UPI0040691A75
MYSFIGFVYPCAFNFAPRDYAFCAGQIILISDNQALYSLLGSTYGGDGRSTMGLPDLRGRTPVGSSRMGSPLPPLIPIAPGEMYGVQYTTLSVAQMPTHSHAAAFTSSGGSSSSATLSVSTSNGDQNAGEGNYFANGKQGFNSVKGFVASADAGTTVDIGGLNVSGSGSGGTVAVDPTGGSRSIDIRNPYLGMNYVIAMEGDYPPRN